MMTDVSLCSSSPIPRITHGNPCTAKTAHCRSENFPVTFFVLHSCECRQISCWVPLVPSPSSFKGEGMQDPKYIWHWNIFEKEAVGPVSLTRAGNHSSYCCEMLRRCISNVAPWDAAAPPNIQISSKNRNAEITLCFQ